MAEKKTKKISKKGSKTPAKSFVKIYDTRDIPFGPLSNNEEYYINLDAKRWPTVTNYILSNMMIKPHHRANLQSARIFGNNKKTDVEQKVKAIAEKMAANQQRPITPEEYAKIRASVESEVSFMKKDIYAIYDFYLGEEQFETVKMALEKAYNNVVYNSEELRNLLVKSENRPIIYMSKNPFFGVGENNKGYNLVGNILMQIRQNIVLGGHELLEKVNKRTVNEQILSYYKAYLVLLQEIQSGQSIEKYSSKTPEEIVNKYQKKHKNEFPYISDENMQDVLDMYNRGQIPIVYEAIHNPSSFFGNMKRYAKNEYSIKIRSEIRSIVFKTFVKQFLREKYPNDNHIKSLLDQLVISLGDEYIKFSEIVLRLYNKNLLPAEITEKIKKALSIVKDDLPESIEEIEEIMGSENVEETEESSQESTEESSQESKESPNDLMEMLSNRDKKQKRRENIQILMDYEGKSAKTYDDIPTKKLREKMEKYLSGEKNSGGDWSIVASIPGNITGIQRIVIGTTNGEPTQEDIQKAIKKYNKKHGASITTANIHTKRQESSEFWKKEREEREEKAKEILEKTEREIVEDYSYKSPDGDPLKITVDNKKDVTYKFSMIKTRKITINGVTFNSIYEYVYAALLTTTGIIKNGQEVTKRPKFMRGMSLIDAKNMLDGRSPKEFKQIFHKKREETFEELMSLLAKRILRKKFEDPYFESILLLTGNSQILWEDPHDILLGNGTKDVPGKNIVGKILMKIRDGLEGKTFPEAKLSELEELYRDKFIMKWAEMRISDMCTVVDRFRRYMQQNEKPQKITAEFTRDVLNTVYSCRILEKMSEETTVIVPQEIVAFVSACKGMKIQYSKDFLSEISRVFEEKINYENSFFGDIRISDLTEDQLPTLEEITEKYEPLWKEAHDKRDKAKEREIKTEWDEEIKNILEIYEMQNNPTKKDKTFDQVFRQKYLETFAKLVNQGLSSTEIAMKIAENDKKWDDRRKLYYKKNTVKKTAEEYKEFEKRRDEFVKQLNALYSTQKKENTEHSLGIGQVAQEYWNKIIAMLICIVSYQKKSYQDAKQIIANIVGILSKETTCEQILFDAAEDCIASAMLNLLTNIKKFKAKYDLVESISEWDISLAMSIITNREFRKINEKKKHVSEKKDKEEENSDVDDLAKLLEETLEKTPEDEEEKNEEKEEELVEEENYEEIQEDDDDDASSVELNEEDWDDFSDDENADFGIGLSETDNVIGLLRPLASGSESSLKKLSINFINAVNTIKDMKIPEKIKTNRINFFATLV